MRGRLLALLVSIPLVTSGAAGVVLHVCQSMGGVVVGDCDCKRQTDAGAHAHHGDHAQHGANQAGAKLHAQPCCTLELSGTSELVATQEASAPKVDNASVALVGLTDDSIMVSRQVCDPGLVRERAPPNIHGPPLFIRNCSFLN